MWDVTSEATVFPSPKHGLAVARRHDVPDVTTVESHHLLGGEYVVVGEHMDYGSYSAGRSSPMTIFDLD